MTDNRDFFRKYTNNSSTRWQAVGTALQINRGNPVTENDQQAKDKPLDAERITFVNNPEDRCPIVLLLDTSYSMSGERIQALNEGLRVFEKELKDDQLAAKRVDVAVVTFGPVVLAQDFLDAQYFQAPSLNADNNTPMGEAVEFGIRLLEQRKAIYRDYPINYYRPWILLITDGAPTDNIDEAKRLVWEGEKNKEFMFFAIGVEDADMSALADLSLRDPLKLRGIAFKELFSWLSSSLSAVSQSQPGTGGVTIAAPDWTIDV